MDYTSLLPQIVHDHKTSARRYKLCRDYDQGKHRLQFASQDFEQKYGNQIAELRENLCPAVISAFTDLLQVTSWGSDAESLDIEQTEGLSRLLALADAEAFRCGDSYALVWPGSDGKPVAHFCRADEIIPHTDPQHPGKLDWAAKIWIDPDTRHGRINIYDADAAHRYATLQPLPKGDTELPESLTSWQPYSDDEAGDVIPHDFGSVPVVWWKLDPPDQRSGGTSILTNVIPLQDGLNKSLADLVITGEAYSRPFRYLLNYKPQATNPLAAAGEYMAVAAGIVKGAVQRRFNPNKSQIFTHDGPGPFGQLPPADLTPLLTAQDAWALKVGRVVGIPAYYLTPTSGDVPSGESLRVLTSRLRARVRRYQQGNTPVLRGLAQLLGIANPVIEWAPILEADLLEQWRIAQIKQGLGLDLQDVLADLGITGLDDVVTRAKAAQQHNAAAMGKALRDGNIGYL